MSTTDQTAKDQANRLLMGGGGPPVFKFPREQKGITAKGTITDLGTQQQRKYVKDAVGPPLYWGDDGKPTTDKSDRPIMQVVITLRLDESGEENRLILNPAMRAAVLDAVQRAEANGLEIGGRLALQYYEDEPQDNPDISPKKLYRAEYAAPVNRVTTDQLLGDG